MNPDVTENIQTGFHTVTVYVTAGNITGTGTTDQERTRNRQRGTQDAHAKMAGLANIAPGQGDWRGDVLSIAGKRVERYRLAERPDVQLIFMNLHDGQLTSVYNGATDTTVIPAGGMVTGSYSYDHADVVAVLSGLMSLFQPTFLRFQDFQADTRYVPAEHPDHRAAMLFSKEASSAHDPTLIQLSYRDYETASMPVNLCPEVETPKNDAVTRYAAYDNKFGAWNWVPRRYYRWSRGTCWAGHNGDGRVQIFVVRSGTVYTHWQNADGSWAGPRVLGGAGGPLAPTIAVGNNADGRLEIFGRRISDHMIVHTWQTTVNSSWYPGWTSLGSPNAGLTSASQIGVPVVTNNADGRLEVFIKNGGGGISTVYQTAVNSSWGSGWVDMHGSGVQDGLAVANPAGKIELFAATTTGILHWRQTAPNAGFAADSLAGPVPVSPPHAAPSADGSLRLAFRRANETDVAVLSQTGAGGSTWGPTPAVLPGQTGVGEVAMIRGGGAENLLFLVGRSDAGTLSVAAQTAPDGSIGAWSELDGWVIDCPAVALDRSGAILLFGVGPDGIVYWRQQTTLTDTAFGDWQPLP